MTARVNLGCGLNAVEGWVNMDRSPSLVLDRFRPVKRVLHHLGVLTDHHMVEWPRNIVRRDARRRLPFADGSVEAVYSSHMLEHLYRDEALRVLVECRRVLSDGGIIRLALPNAIDVAAHLLAPGDELEAAHRFHDALAAHPSSPPSLLARLFSSPPHRWQPTPALVEDMLVRAGFRDARVEEYQRGRLPDLERVENRPASIFVEAAK